MFKATHSHLLLSILFILCLLFSACNEHKNVIPEPEVRSLSVQEKEVVTASNDFALELMSSVEKSSNQNFFISSFSVSTALSMVMNGAVGESQTGFIETLSLEGMTPDQINKTYLDLVSYIYGLDPSVTLNVANSNWYTDQLSINPDFQTLLKEYYDAEVNSADFKSPATLSNINKWVEDETHGKIKDILSEINQDDVMFLINAIYFKAQWTTQFDPEKTHDGSFTLQDGSEVHVPMMFAEKVKLWSAFDEELQAQVVDLPYGNENYGLTIIIPNHPEEINSLLGELTSDKLNQLINDLQETTIDLNLPKFKMEFKKDLLDNLIDMGMPITGLDDLFTEDVPLAISKVIHQSFLEVNEEGSEAAAATVVGIELTSMPPRISINSPFIFFIRERNSNTLLFSGKLVDPR